MLRPLGQAGWRRSWRGSDGRVPPCPTLPPTQARRLRLRSGSSKGRKGGGRENAVLRKKQNHLSPPPQNQTEGETDPPLVVGSNRFSVLAEEKEGTADAGPGEPPGDTEPSSNVSPPPAGEVGPVPGEGKESGTVGGDQVGMDTTVSLKRIKEVSSSEDEGGKRKAIQLND